MWGDERFRNKRSQEMQDIWQEPEFREKQFRKYVTPEKPEEKFIDKIYQIPQLDDYKSLLRQFDAEEQKRMLRAMHATRKSV